MRQEATIATTYIGDGTDKQPYRAATFDLLQDNEDAEDVTGMPVAEITANIGSSPAVTIRMRAEEARLDAIDSPEHRIISRVSLEEEF